MDILEFMINVLASVFIGFVFSYGWIKFILNKNDRRFRKMKPIAPVYGKKEGDVEK